MSVRSSSSLELYTLSILVSLLLLHFCYLTTAQTDPFVFCGTNGNYTSGSPYQQNLNLTLSSLTTNASVTGYYTISKGSNPDTAYGLIQCRAYLSKEDCQTCAAKIVTEAVRLCPYQKKATRFSGECSVQYADWSFFAELETSPVVMIVTYGGENPTNQTRFSSQLGSLFRKLSLQARNDPNRLATGNINYLSFRPIFAMFECTRDVSEDDCFSCLQSLFGAIPSDQTDAQVSAISCNARYGLSRFFRDPPPPPPPPPPPAPPPSSPPQLPPAPPPRSATSHEKGSRTIAKLVTPVALVITPVTLVLLLILGIYYCFFLRKHRGRKDDDESSSETLLIPFAILREATCNFSNANKLGQGGFGAVYKGKMSDGEEVAVKRQLTSSSQGMEEVKTEVTLVAKLEHTNLVRLLGFCIQGKERLLVYEYIPNGSLDQVLFGNTTLKKSKLNWETRYRIIVGIARGMQYLHEDSRLNIIHRDLKGGNILLDESMNPKISDFGTARLFSGTQTHINTGRVLGTRGYMSPEYVNNGIFSTKSDVYSFGILILEIVSGDRISSPRNYSNLQSDKVAAKRPTMSSIVLMLSSNTSTFSPLSKPGFFVRNEGSMSDSDMEEESAQPSINELYCNTMKPVVEAAHLLFFITCLVNASDDDFPSSICNPDANYTSGSSYQQSLNLTLTSLAANASRTGYIATLSTTTGQGGPNDDTVYGLLQCRGYTPVEACQTCADALTASITKLCPNRKEASRFDDNCTLQYADWNFFSTSDILPRYKMYSSNNATDPVAFYSHLDGLLRNLSSKAADSPSRLAFGRSGYNDDSAYVYAMVQCTLDISGNDCLDCIRSIAIYIPKMLKNRDGGRLFALSCNFRFESYSFFPQSLPPLPPATGNKSTNADGKNSKPLVTLVVIPVLASVAVIVLISAAIYFFLRVQASYVNPDGGERGESLLFSLDSLKTATMDFASENKLGEGGFGQVYKGNLPDGQDIAVKRLSASSNLNREDLRTEVMVITKLLHRNLIRLLGFCLEEEENILVYEYLPNGSLDKILYDPNRRFDLDWGTRYKIVMGIARGLQYLHEDSQLNIVHRSLKASNILLDESMTPKICDFGLARLFLASEGTRIAET
ncbi:Cysteine-rich receptor-like protein kinase 8 [Linum grandiflorum]